MYEIVREYERIRNETKNKGVRRKEGRKAGEDGTRIPNNKEQNTNGRIEGMVYT